jgi:ABC-2 type transport system ATP-binding protein
VLRLAAPLAALPQRLAGYPLQLADDGQSLVLTYGARAERTGITILLADLREAGVSFTDLETRQSSLEEIFVDLVRQAG